MKLEQDGISGTGQHPIRSYPAWRIAPAPGSFKSTMKSCSLGDGWCEFVISSFQSFNWLARASAFPLSWDLCGPMQLKKRHLKIQNDGCVFVIYAMSSWNSECTGVCLISRERWCNLLHKLTSYFKVTKTLQHTEPQRKSTWSTEVACPRPTPSTCVPQPWYLMA